MTTFGVYDKLKNTQQNTQRCTWSPDLYIVLHENK